MTGRFRLIIGFVFLLATAGGVEAASLKVSPARFMVQNVEPGRPYDLYKEAKLRLTIFNDDDTTRTWALTTHRPSERGRWEEGYSEIPDAKWCWFDKKEVTVPAQGSAHANLYLYIPDEEQYFNQHWVVTLGIGGKPGAGGIALAIDIRMQIETKSKSDLDEKPHGLIGLEPGALQFDDVTPGKNEKRVAVLHNNDDTRHSYTIRSLFKNDAINRTTYLTRSYSAIPELTWIGKPVKIEVEAGGSAPLPIELQIPDAAGNYGKKWEDLILIQPDEGRAAFVRVQIQTGEKAKRE